jgi:hypothetical protein
MAIWTTTAQGQSFTHESREEALAFVVDALMDNIETWLQEVESGRLRGRKARKARRDAQKIIAIVFDLFLLPVEQGFEVHNKWIECTTRRTA